MFAILWRMRKAYSGCSKAATGGPEQEFSR